MIVWRVKVPFEVTVALLLAAIGAAVCLPPALLWVALHDVGEMQAEL
jgi:hypothetical protein